MQFIIYIKNDSYFNTSWFDHYNIDGDLSYSRALATGGSAMPPSSLVATTFDTLADLYTKYGTASVKESLAALSAAGATVGHGIDATDFCSTLPTLIGSGAFAFDVIVFNFPHSGLKSVPSNRLLLSNFFSEASAVLVGDEGRIEVTLKTTAKYRHWRLTELAMTAGLHVVAIRPFVPPHLYLHRRTTHDVDGNAVQGVMRAATWVFARQAPRIAVRLPTWLVQIHHQSGEKPVCSLCDIVFTTEGDLEKHRIGKRHVARVKEAKRRLDKKSRKDQVVGTNSGSFCELCRVFSNSAASAAVHLIGRRHVLATNTVVRQESAKKKMRIN